MSWSANVTQSALLKSNWDTNSRKHNNFGISVKADKIIIQKKCFNKSVLLLPHLQACKLPHKAKT